jgi:chemotaxis protein MotB
VHERPQGVTVEIGASVLFAPGQAALQQGSRPALQAVAAALAQGGYQIRVEGYTDDTPIATVQFPSNWELSAARASSVVRQLAQDGVDPRSLAAVGYGEYRPLEPNTSAESRARNRRVSISVLPGVDAHAADDLLQSDPPMEFDVRRR